MYRIFAALTAFVVLALAQPVAAQQPAARAPTPATSAGRAAIVGAVVDSLRGGFLIGADVLIEGTTLSLTTDSLGEFHADSLRPGTYRVGVFHPLLDTLGLSLSTPPFRVAADSVAVIVLAVPSATTLITRSCAGRPLREGGSAVMGIVTDPETLQPIAGAEVSLAWTHYEVSREFGIRSSARVFRDSTDVSGAYRICGLPSSLEASLQAKRGVAMTAEVPIAIGDAPRELFLRSLLLPAAGSDATVGTAKVSGRVVLSDGGKAAGSRVELVGTEHVTLTDDEGNFSMAGLPSGTRVLLARRIGYGAEATPVDLNSRDAKRVTIALPRFVALMDTILVRARRERSLDRVGFSQRQRSSLGRFVDRDEIVRRNPTQLTDVLRQIPGLRVVHDSRGQPVIVGTRGPSGFGNKGGCVQYVVDGIPWHSIEPGDIDTFINPGDVMGVEVYQAGVTPGQFVSSGRDCVTIVIWTRVRVRD